MIEASQVRRNAAASLRDLNVAFIRHEIGPTELSALSEQLALLTAMMNGQPDRLRSFAEITEEPNAPEVLDGEVMDHFDQCFVTGSASPVGIAGTLRREADSVVFRGAFPATFEGMPGFAHGGIIAAAFDDIIGLVMGRLHRVPSPTVRVTVSFSKPVPLNKEVVLSARRLRSEGRKHFVEATASVDGVICAQADGLLVALRGESGPRLPSVCPESIAERPIVER